MEAVALYDFHATSKDELSFTKGATLKILSMKDDPNWWKAEFSGREGLVPRNYIQLKPANWYMGKVSRASSESTLLKQPYDGAFLLRDSETVPGEFSLSVKYGQSVQHFRVIRDQNGKYSIWVEKFDSINELLNYHRKKSLSREKKLFLVDMVDEVVQAMYNFEPQEEGELRLKKGDVISVLDKSDPNWWKGLCNNVEGLFPASYVKSC